MLLLTTLLLILSTLTLISAVPTPLRRRGFTINQVIKPRSTTEPGIINLAGIHAGAFTKFGAAVPPGVKDAAGNGTALARPEGNDREYLTPVLVGDTEMNLDIDTGSADLWVFSTELPDSEYSGHSIYKPSSKATKMEGYTWKISYGDDSSASGSVYKDDVTVGGVTAHGQAVEAAQEMSQQFTADKNNDGLLGLAFSHANTVKPKKQTTFFDTVKDSLDTPVFAVALKHHKPGTYDFGHIDKSKHKGKLKYTDVDSSQGYWMFTASGYDIGNGKTNTNPIRGIVDTGSTLLMLPEQIVAEYYKQVKGAELSLGAGGYVFPCDAELPDFTVLIGDGDSKSKSNDGIDAGLGIGLGGGSDDGGTSIGSGNGDSSLGSGLGEGLGGLGDGGNIGSSDGGLGGSQDGIKSGSITVSTSGPLGSISKTFNKRTSTNPTITTTTTNSNSNVNTNSDRNNNRNDSNSGGTYKAVTPGKYINLAPVSSDGKTCYGGIQANEGMDFSIFGDVFLKSQYVAFDARGPKLGFAPQAS